MKTMKSQTFVSLALLICAFALSALGDEGKVDQPSERLNLLGEKQSGEWAEARDYAKSQICSAEIAPSLNTGCKFENGTISLLENLPTQKEAEPVIIECEDALKLVFQDDVFARKDGYTGDGILQIKQSAEDYTPQADILAAGGNYVDYCSRAQYVFGIQTPGKYQIWVRHWVPFVATWIYSLKMDDAKPVNIIMDKKSIPSAKTWFWVRGPVVMLEKGSHNLDIKDLQNGKRMDRIILTSDMNFVPAGIEGLASSKAAVTEGVVVSDPICPADFRMWNRISYDAAKSSGTIAFAASNDNGKSWLDIPSDGNLSAFAKSGGVIFRVTLLRGADGISPEIKNLRAWYESDIDKLALLSSKGYQMLFSKKNGSLKEIKNLKTGTTYCSFKTDSDIFEILLKAPGENNQEWVSSSNTPLVRKELTPTNVVFEWLVKESIRIVLTVSSLDDERSSWEVTVMNDHPTLDVCALIAPKLHHLRIGETAADDTLAWPYSAGEFLRNPAAKGEVSTCYPNGFPWFDLYTMREGLYLGSHDPLLAETIFTSVGSFDQRHIDLTICKKHRIQSGTSQTYRFTMAVHSNDWHRGAEIYRDYFYSHYSPYRPPQWFRDIDFWVVSGSAGMNKDMKATYEAVEDGFKQAAFLGTSYIQGWGSTFNGACPTYYVPRKERGGEAMFTRMNKRWRDAGGSIGYYFHGNSIGSYYILSDKYFDTPWSEYPETQRPPSWDWYVKNAVYASEGKKFDKEAWLQQVKNVNDRVQRKEWVSNGRIEDIDRYQNFTYRTNDFPDFLRKSIRAYVENYGCNTAYLDTFTFANGPDFNPYLKLHGESDIAMYKLAWLRKSMDEMRSIDPSFISITEGVLDVFGSYMAYLLSGFDRDGNILRYTLPDQIYFLGQCNGFWDAAKSKRSLSQAFVYGMKFDILRVFPHTYYMIRLRQRVSPFLNYAVFSDTAGLSVSNPSIKAFAHVMTPETSHLIPHGGSKSVTITTLNEKMEGGVISYVLPDKFSLRYGYVFDLYSDEAKPLLYKLVGNTVTFNAPTAESAAIILIDKVVKECEWTAIPVQTGTNTVSAALFNFTTDPISLSIEARCRESAFADPKRTITLMPGKTETFFFSEAVPTPDFKLANIVVCSKEKEKTYMISLGAKTGSIPKTPVLNEKPSEQAPVK